MATIILVSSYLVMLWRKLNFFLLYKHTFIIRSRLQLSHRAYEIILHLFVKIYINSEGRKNLKLVVHTQYSTVTSVSQNEDPHILISIKYHVVWVWK